MKLGYAILFLAAILIAGCAEPAPEPITQDSDNKNPNDMCSQVITPAISPQGKCIEFPTPCDVPTGYTITEQCEDTSMEEDLAEYSFDTNLMFCDYLPTDEKYIFFYRIRNLSGKTALDGATIWLTMPENGASQKKTIQENFEDGRVMWEKNSFSYDSKIYRGQYWEIRDINEFSEIEYNLIFCEGEEQCNPKEGIILDNGLTTKNCTNTGNN